MDAIIALTMTITGGITGYTVGFETPLACPGYSYNCADTPAWAAFPLEWFESGAYQ